jgi:hypothetical protein
MCFATGAEPTDDLAPASFAAQFANSLTYEPFDNYRDSSIKVGGKTDIDIVIK